MNQRMVAALALVAAISIVGCTGKYKDQIAEQEAKITELENDLATTQKQLDDEKARTAKLNADLNKALADYQAQEKLWMEQKDSQTSITVPDEVLFGSGLSDLSPEGRQVVDKIADVVKGYSDRTIMIEGHSDNVPIGPTLKDKYFSNWELSASRACSVLRYLNWHHKIDATRLSAVGYGEYRPIADNESADGRARNRRVVLVIAPQR